MWWEREGEIKEFFVLITNKQTKKNKNIEIIIKLNDNWDDLWLLFEGNMTTLK